MSLTYAQLNAIVEELAALVVPSGVQKVFENERGAIVLQLRGGGETRYLLVDGQPGWSRVHLVERKPRQPERPTAFVMLLRKHIVGCGVVGIELASRDRVVTLHLLRRGEDGETPVKLVAELFGRQPTVVLIVNGVVIGTQVRNPRIPPGSPYTPPPPSNVDEGDDPLDLATLPVGERSARAATYLDEARGEAATQDQRKELGSRLKAEAKRARRLVANLEADLERAENAQDYRRRGELLQSAYGMEVPRGATEVMVPDYYADGAPMAAIALDPARSLKENIARYFHEYRRYKEAIDGITERLILAMERADAFDAARERLATIEDDDEVADLERELTTAGLLRPRKKQQGPRRTTAPQPPYRTFVGRTGARILVGRGAKHNDALTTKVARGRDVWMHARDWAGAHVVIRMDKDGEPDGEDLRDAALLAVHFSKGRGDSLVDVTYTRAKWVRKPKGAAPGLVTVAGGSTIAVAPDQTRLEQLFESEQADA